MGRTYFSLGDRDLFLLLERGGDLVLELEEDFSCFMIVSSFSPFARCVVVSVMRMFFRTFSSLEGGSDGDGAKVGTGVVDTDGTKDGRKFIL